MTDDSLTPTVRPTALPLAAPRISDLHLALAVALCAAIAYATALVGTFVYDDLHSVAQNPGVQDLGNALRFFVDPSLFSTTGAMYRPVLLLTFAVDHALGGGAALPFKLGNVLLHALATLLLFLLARRWAAGRAAAAVGALLFAVHPAASEAINFVSARSEGLLVCGLLLGLYAHRRALDAATARARRGWLLGVLGAGVVACGSKETGVVLPALLLVQEWLARGEPRAAGALAALWRDRAAVLRRLLPLALLVLGYLLLRKALLGQATTTLVGRESSDPMFGHTRDLLTQLATMGLLLPKALLGMIAPVHLSADHPASYQRTFASLPVLCGWAGVLAATAVGLHGGRRTPLAFAGTALMWATALPWVVVPLNVPLAEHRLYGPLAGLALVLTHLLQRAARAPATSSSGIAADLPWRRSTQAALALVVLLFAGRSAVRSLDYRDEVRLWQSALALEPGSFRAHWGLGTQYLLRGDARAAERSLARAVALYPGFRAARHAWVSAMLKLPPEEDWPFRARGAAEELLRQKPDDPYYRHLLAAVLLQQGALTGDRATLEAAEARSLSCLDVGPPKALVFRLAAACRRQLDDPEGALRHLDRALELGLDFAGVRAERAELLYSLGRLAEADRELRRATQMAPMDSAVRAAWARRAAAPPK